MASQRTSRRALTIPAALSVIALSACGQGPAGSDGGDGTTITDAIDPPTPSCEPWSTEAGAPPSTLRARFDLSPCPAVSAGPRGAVCVTATPGCSVIYDEPTGSEFAASYVSCSVNDNRCLVGFDSDGAPLYERCPILDVPLRCFNNIGLSDIRTSNFSCGGALQCYANGTMGQRVANFQRTVDGTITRSPCPADCLPLV